MVIINYTLYKTTKFIYSKRIEFITAKKNKLKQNEKIQAAARKYSDLIHSSLFVRTRCEVLYAIVLIAIQQMLTFHV